MSNGVPVFIQVIVVLSAGSVVFWLFSFIAKMLSLFHTTEDYRRTMESGSRDPKAKMETFRKSRELNRLIAAVIAVALLSLFLWLS